MTDDRKTFDTGAQRSKDADYARFDLIPFRAMEAMAIVLKAGAEKYGENNWVGLPVADCGNHALRHLQMWLAGDRSDSHLWNTLCNLAFMIHQTYPEEIQRQGLENVVKLFDHYKMPERSKKSEQVKEPAATNPGGFGSMLTADEAIVVLLHGGMVRAGYDSTGINAPIPGYDLTPNMDHSTIRLRDDGQLITLVGDDGSWERYCRGMEAFSKTPAFLNLTGAPVLKRDQAFTGLSYGKYAICLADQGLWMAKNDRDGKESSPLIGYWKDGEFNRSLSRVFHGDSSCSLPTGGWILVDRKPQDMLKDKKLVIEHGDFHV